MCSESVYYMDKEYMKMNCVIESLKQQAHSNAVSVDDNSSASSQILNGRFEILTLAGVSHIARKDALFSRPYPAHVLLNAFSEIRNAIALPNLRVRLVGTTENTETIFPGATTQTYEDVALMRVLPNFAVLIPSDIVMMRALVSALENHPHPAYIKILSHSVWDYNQGKEQDFSIGGSRFLSEGEDITICACGIMVGEALKAVKTLQAQGIFADLIDCYSIKPFPERALLSSIRKTGCCVVAEKHSVTGGLFSAVAECVSRAYPVPVKHVAIEDHFGQSGKQEELDEYNGLSAREIVRNAVQLLTMCRR